MIRTSIAGSLPKPAWLAEPEKLWAGWRLSDDVLFEGQSDAALNWIKFQEEVGIDIVSDGEQFRKHFVHGFLESIEGIDWNKITTMGIRNDRYDAEVPTVTGELRRTGPVHSAGVKVCLQRAKNDYKFTLPGPMTICDTIANGYYKSREEMALAFAKILNEEARELDALGVTVIQFDEPAFNAFTKEAADWGVEMLEVAKAGLTCTTAVHICYGYGIQQNLDWKETLGDQWRQYEDFFPALNKSSLNQVSLECADSHVPHEVMSILKDKQILVGAINVGTSEIETPEKVCETLEAASQFVEPERIIACTNCGMAPLPRKVAEGKLRSLSAGAKLFTQRNS